MDSTDFRRILMESIDFRWILMDSIDFRWILVLEGGVSNRSGPWNLHGISMESPWNLHGISIASPSHLHRCRIRLDPLYNQMLRSWSLEPPGLQGWRIRILKFFLLFWQDIPHARRLKGSADCEYVLVIFDFRQHCGRQIVLCCF